MPHLQFEINQKSDNLKIVANHFKADPGNQYGTFTQHPGEDFHLVEKFLAEWETGEDPLAD